MAKEQLIYLASPYTSDDCAVREIRFDAVCAAAACLMRSGHHVFSPIAHGHSIARYGLPGEFTYWQSYCENTLQRCDAMYVLMLDGWRESVGVLHEIKLAIKKNIPVLYFNELEIPGLTK